MLGSTTIFTPQNRSCSAAIFTPQQTKIQQTHILHASTQTHPGTYLREVGVLVRVIVVPEELCGPQVLLNHLDLGLITPCWAHQTQSVTHWQTDDSMLNAKPAHFFTSFSSDCYVVLCWLVEQRVPCWALSPTSFLSKAIDPTAMPRGAVLTGGIEDSGPNCFLTSFRPDRHVVLCWLVE